MNKTYVAENEREVTVNMGPQHPSTHGVLRFVVKLDGERIIESDPDVGYLHRGFEKFAENMTYQQFMPFTDRLDYLASMNNNFAYAMAVEKLLGISNDIPKRAEYIRVIMAELGRIASHLVWLATHALDIGAMTVFLYCFREREYILDMYEMACGNKTIWALLVATCTRDVHLVVREKSTERRESSSWVDSPLIPSSVRPR